MNTPGYTNLYLCLDRQTKIVIWAKTNWKGYPNLRITDPDIVFVNYKNIRGINVRQEHFQQWEVLLAIDPTTVTEHEIKKVYTLEKRYFEITEDQKNKFKIVRTKCAGIYSWLDGMYDYMSRFNGVLPGIYVASNEHEASLLNDEREKVRMLANELVNQYYDRLWSCTTEKEFYSCLTEANKNTLFY